MAFAAYLILAKQATVWPRGWSTTRRGGSRRISPSCRSCCARC